MSDVVTALQPSIEAAIAEALASLRATSVNSYSNNEAAFSSGFSTIFSVALFSSFSTAWFLHLQIMSTTFPLAFFYLLL